MTASTQLQERGPDPAAGDAAVRLPGPIRTYTLKHDRGDVQRAGIKWFSRHQSPFKTVS